jgi:hypothetical protein
MAFRAQRRVDHRSLLSRQSEMPELVDLGASGVVDPHDDISELGCRQVDHALAAAADHLEAVVGAGNDAADKRRRELHDCAPAHRHDVRASSCDDETSTIGPGSR